MSCGLRDVIEFESLGRPGVLIASDAFAQAAANQVELLGQPKLAYALAPHPIQDRTDDELRAMARAIADEALRAIMQA
ncbi:MAG: hypothetical protein QOH62_3955 [Solirubrobacteraceae bacterium]|nr:hypothetical protein [Solirubrobacteraceae bacterium]